MKSLIIKAVIVVVILVSIVFYYSIPKSIEYTAPIQVQKSDSISEAKKEIQKQIEVLNKKDEELSSKISVLETERERIREIKMSFSTALK